MKFDVTTLSKLDLIFRIKRRMNSRIKNLEFHIKILGANSEATREINFLDNQVRQLDVNPTIRHAHAVANIIKKWRTVKIQSECLFGVYLKPTARQCDDAEIAFLGQMHQTTKKARISEIRYRLTQELEQRVNDGWYLVFQTLTVNGDCERKVFSKGSQEFSNYIRRVDRAIATRVHGSVRKAEIKLKENQENAWHKYFCVVERGAANGRLHMHVLHLCKKLPFGSDRDPNYGAKVPFKRCLNNWAKYWSNGFSTPIAVRLSANDAYTRLGWTWPVERDKEKKIWSPYAAKPSGAVANYITKYVTKSIQQPTRKDYFRCRMTRNLGMTKIINLVETVNVEALKLLMVMKHNVLLRTTKIAAPPMSLVRAKAAQRIYQMIPSQTMLSIRRETKPLRTLLEQWRNMTKMKHRHKLPNITLSSMTKLLNSAISKQWKIINETAEVGGFRPSGPLRYT